MILIPDINTDINTFEQTTKIPNTDNNYQMGSSRGWKIVSANLFRRVFVWVTYII